MRIVDRLDDIRRFYEMGLSIPAIAGILRLSQSGVEKALTRAGIHRPHTKRKLRERFSGNRLLQACFAILHETRTLERCPGCLRKRTLWTQDLGPLGWIAMCDPQECGFVWYRRNGPPECVQNALCTMTT
jgi:hypothetical protein